MHRPRHAHTIHSLQWAAFLLCLNRFLIVTTVLAVGALLVTGEARWSKLALILGGAVLVLALVQWICAASGKCPLCTMPVLSRKGCSKHRNARCVAGSHRFPVAFGVLFKGHFRCPYCNEPTMLALKDPARKH
jgi:Na+-transporting NADH:ubiquinone oxidoreductase subunit NqrB